MARTDTQKVSNKPSTVKPGKKTSVGKAKSTVVGKANSAATAAKEPGNAGCHPLGEWQTNSASTGSAAPKDTDSDEMAALKAKLAHLEKELNSQAKAQKQKKKIRSIVKPEWSTIVVPQSMKARKLGKIFVAMDLKENERDIALYNDVQNNIHHFVSSAGIDVKVDFRNQDPSKLTQVYKATATKHPWMTDYRYPSFWATAELVKQYLRNRRATLKKKEKKLAEFKAAQKNADRDNSAMETDGDDDGQDNGSLNNLEDPEEPASASDDDDDES